MSYWLKIALGSVVAIVVMILWLLGVSWWADTEPEREL